MALNFNHFAAEANQFLKEYTKELMLEGDTEKAGRILSSILHGLREIIATQESLQLIAQFPMFLKAVYVNGWTIHKKPKIKTMEQFIDLVRKFDGVTGLNDFKSDELAEQYINATFLLLRRYVSLGEMEDIRSELPKDLKNMVYQRIMF
ncbi:MAG: DUF2267 domain-containing protein [Bacteroidia bacterium]|nr:DUF2267 domain-containing protein [Bacteroidia bacterium]NNF31319.1 DUF2267 domain-containing protein [Flavobacteriaceae bacterium]MBT8275767.1 DUF2267 domain-containing protein [Bacteroidia bacterium]NNJ82920.1 DUF2267 domain-containing protein [Flavobacteriaceae bacterium]NNK55673.1 DUF2267 domain-containing protein [Flavobacteriaceae bacterium]